MAEIMWGHLDNLLATLTPDLDSLVPWDKDMPPEVLEARYGVVQVEVIRQPRQWWQHYRAPEIDLAARPVVITYRAVPEAPTPEQAEAHERQARAMRAREREARVSAALEVLAAQTTAQMVRDDVIPADQFVALAVLYPDYAIGKSYQEGDMFQFHGALIEVIQAHTSQADWRPDETPALYKMHRPAGVRLPWVRPTRPHDAYAEGEECTWADRAWRSLIPANVTEPGSDPRWWEDITDPPAEPEPEPEPEPDPDPGDGIADWAPGQTVAPGDLRRYDGVVYSAIQGHTTQEGWEPPATPALWEMHDSAA